MTSTTDQELSLLSVRPNQVVFDNDQKTALIDTLRIKHASDADLGVFFHLCRRTGLDPFRRQIYMIARQEYDSDAGGKVWRQTFQTGIDGYRVIAARAAAQQRVELRTAKFKYYDHDGTVYDAWWKTEPPAMIRATVQLGDQDPVSWDARFDEYVPMKDEYEKDTWVDGKKQKGRATGKQIPQGMWAKRPTAQLEKCAEAGALRRACPEDLSGLYVFEEMQHGTQEPSQTTLVDDGSGEAAPIAKRDWEAELAAAETIDEVRAVFRAAAQRGEKSPELNEKINARAAEIATVASGATPPQTDAPDDVPNPSPDPEPPAGTPVDADDGHDLQEPGDPEPMDVEPYEPDEGPSDPMFQLPGDEK